MSGPSPRWSWVRLGRVAALTLATLAVIDLALAPMERRLDARLADGALRNGPSIAAADGSRRVMLGAPAAARREAVGVAGSSITYGAGVADDETIPAYMAAQMRHAGDQRPVFNLSQAGGGPRDVIPVATAMGTHPLRLLLVEFQPHNFGGVQSHPPDEIGDDELPMLLAGTAAQERLLDAAGMTPSWQRRVEESLGTLAHRAWRAYRVRTHLWVDDQFPPMNVAWTLRRGAAAAGVLPRRFQGQSTNVGKLPWRRAYRDGQVPSAVQRLTFTGSSVDEERYAPLLLLSRLAREARVPLVYYEAPLNLAFQREFHFMSEDDIARLASFRAVLLARMRADGMEVLEAPELPDDGYLDRAHLTPLGARAMAEHLTRALAARLPPLGRRP